MITRNATIEAASISCGEDSRGTLSADLTLDYGGFCQGFGGYALYLPKTFKHHTVQSPAGHHIFRLMEVAGVSRWSDLIGKSIRVEQDDQNRIIRIGHIVKDIWYEPGRELKATP